VATGAGRPGPPWLPRAAALADRVLAGGSSVRRRLAVIGDGRSAPDVRVEQLGWAAFGIRPALRSARRRLSRPDGRRCRRWRSARLVPGTPGSPTIVATLTLQRLHK